ncbi:MAG TPA: hypothetical protein VF189_04535 [Patescibacteria group bacterium]
MVAELQKVRAQVQRQELGAQIAAKQDEIDNLSGVRKLGRRRLEGQVAALKHQYEAIEVDSPIIVLSRPAPADLAAHKAQKISEIENAATKLREKALADERRAIVDLKHDLDESVKVTYKGVKELEVGSDFRAFVMTLQNAVVVESGAMNSLYTESERKDPDYRAPQIVITQAPSGTLSATVISGQYGDFSRVHGTVTVNPMTKREDKVAYNMAVKKFDWTSAQELAKRGQKGMAMAGLSAINTVDAQGKESVQFHSTERFNDTFLDEDVNNFLRGALRDSTRVLGSMTGRDISSVVFAPARLGETSANLWGRVSEGIYRSEAVNDDRGHTTNAKVVGGKGIIEPFLPGSSFMIAH